MKEQVLWLIVILVSVCALVHGNPRVDPLVATNLGLIRGLRSEFGFSKFLGIPYALVNEKNPFGHSTPHPGFETVYDAYQSTECPQVDRYDEIVGSLDCLTMDIYVPETASSQNRLAVMVWVHGGAFIAGSSGREATDPVSLLRHDIILVTINYRLSAYGFMCLDHPEVPGNQGLKDQVLALRWVNENIEAFGGNREQITFFGESAGALSVHLHLFSSYEKLFQRAIIMSGPIISPLLPLNSEKNYPIKLASILGVDFTDINEALEYLSSIDPHTIIQAADDLDDTTSSYNPLTLPCIETEMEGVEHFLTSHPKNTVSLKASTTSVIIGNSNNESVYQYVRVNNEDLLSFSFGDTLSVEFEFDDESQDAVDSMTYFYVGEETFTENVKWNIVDFNSDYQYVYPTQRSAVQLLNGGSNTVYRYLFSYNGNRNLMKTYMNIDYEGASHSDILGYLFELDIYTEQPTPEDQLIIDRMTTLLTNFAKYGDPTPETTELLPVKWKPITTTSQHCYEVDSEVSLLNRPLHRRMTFWEVFYELYNDYQIWSD